MDRNELRICSMQYENALQKAEQTKGEESIQYYIKAIRAQLTMANMLDGADAERHKREAERLYGYVKAEKKKENIIAADTASGAKTGGTVENENGKGKGGSIARSGDKKDDSLQGFDPASLRLNEKPSACFEDFGDMSDEIAAVVNSLDTIKNKRDYPGLAKYMSEASPHVLLYGPPGGGKTHFCKAIAKYTMENFEGSAFFLVMASSITNHLVGMSEKRLAALFEEVERYEMPVLCIDEIEALCPVRDGDSPHYANQLVSDMLQRINGAAGSTKALVIGATNYPWKIDVAIRSRLATHVYVGLPDQAHIRGYLEEHITPFLGKDPAYISAMIEMCVARLKHASYRVLEWVWQELGIIAFNNTIADNVPDKNLSEFIPLKRGEIEGVLDRVSIDYDPEYIERLRDAARW